MGPLMTADLVGIDVLVKIAEALVLRFGGYYHPTDVFWALHGANMLGAKTDAGFYLWEKGRVKMEDGKPVVNPRVLELVGSSLPELAKLG